MDEVSEAIKITSINHQNEDSVSRMNVFSGSPSRIALVFRYLITLLIASAALVSQAETVTTPGAIASIEAPSGLIFNYQAEMDALQFYEEGVSQITVSVLPSGEPKALLSILLDSLGAGSFSNQIQDEEIAGYPAASLRVEAQSSDRITLLAGRELNVVFRIQDATSSAQFDAWLQQAAESIQLAPAQFPSELVGNFRTGSQYSGPDYGGVSGYSESSVFLSQQGEVIYGGYTSFSGPGASGLGSGGAPSGAWQVRGNRLIVFSPPSDFLNARFQVFRNGIEVYPAGGETLLWVRQ